MISGDAIRFGVLAVTGRKRCWTLFLRDESGTAALEYIILLSGIGLVLVAVLNSPEWGIAAMYQMIYEGLILGHQP